MSTDRSRGASAESNSGKLSTRLSPRLLARVTAAVEDGPYHSRSHLVRAALHLLLPPTDDRRASDPTAQPASDVPRGVRVAEIREHYPEPECAGRIEVDLLDDRHDNGEPTSHTFVYAVDRSNRTATVRTYEPPVRVTHEQATSLGRLRESADAALASRNWRIEGTDSNDASASQEPPRPS